jgi:hypothetical protein
MNNMKEHETRAVANVIANYVRNESHHLPRLLREDLIGDVRALRDYADQLRAERIRSEKAAQA